MAEVHCNPWAEGFARSQVLATLDFVMGSLFAVEAGPSPDCRTQLAGRSAGARAVDWTAAEAEALVALEEMPHFVVVVRQN